MKVLETKLVELEAQPGELAKVAAAISYFFLFFVVWNVALLFAPVDYTVLNQGEENKARLARVILSPPAEIGIAGSSLAHRLSDHFFDVPAINASIPGGNPANSVAILSAARPAHVVIELNVLDRSLDFEIEKHVARATDPPYGIPAFGGRTTPVRAAIATLGNLDDLVGWKKSKRRASARDLLARAPKPEIGADDLKKVARGWDKRPIAKDKTRANAVRIKDVADTLEKAGTRVHYVLLPVHAALRVTNYYSRGARALAEVDPLFGQRLLDIDWKHEELRYAPDGAHLDNRSAALVAKTIQNAILDSHSQTAN